MHRINLWLSNTLPGRRLPGMPILSSCTSTTGMTRCITCLSVALEPRSPPDSPPDTTHKEIAANESLQLHPYVSKKNPQRDSAVECPDESTASKDFSRCSNEVICTCSHTRSRVQCICPQYSLKDSQNSITTLPIIASHLNITASDTVIIDTHDAEISLLITSKKQIQR
ncbi:hypothetical protein COOONC_03272 [Cooperia oncophora]